MGGSCRGIIIDWGGVLTTPLGQTIDSWLRAERIDAELYYRVLTSWVGPGYAPGNGHPSPVHSLERGEVDPAQFERGLAAELRLVDGGPVMAEGLLNRMFAGFAPVEEMYALVRQARLRGMRTCLLSNSWGNGYPRERFAGTFDAVVISGEVGMRKPEQEIFAHAADLVGLPAAECAFVDDIEYNVTAARELGMTGILHRTPEETRAELARACGITFDIAGDTGAGGRLRT